MHLRAPKREPEGQDDASPRAAEPSRVGFVVSKAVGNAVVRNRVKRRLRHLTLDRLPRLPSGARVVVRALPPAAGSAYADLGADLDRCLARVGLDDLVGAS
ncbi:MAG: ribonuclease protein component [Marmoricola sp.]|nr:ribonuclease protein component [Marmoricola sp.]